ncbi:MAG: condensation domain-containing protein, partial [Actinomycetota bacterium]
MGDLSADKRRLLEQRLGKRPAAKTAAPVGIPRRPDGPPPLSAGQEAIRFAVSARPLEPVYNVVHRHLVDGPFDPSAFETALRSVVERHESLITSFGTDRRTLDIADAVSFDFLQMTDGETTGDDASDGGDALARFERIATDQATTPFDLVDGPLLRCVCVELGPDRHGLVLALHHLSADAASFGILWRELDLSARGRPITTPSVRYSDHAVWQRSQITDDDRTFWAERLPSDAVAPRPDLAAPSTPTDADRRSAGYLTVPLGVTPAALADAGLRSQPFFLACLADLLDRYDAAALEEPAGRRAPAATTIGIAGSVRDHPDLDDVIGYFLNTLPLSVPVDRDTTIADRVTAVEGALATALRHRHVPYHEIVSARRANGDREPDPISVLFVVDESFDASFGDAEVTSDLVHNGTAVAPLTMFVRPVADGFEASAEWDTTKFDGTRVAAFLDSFPILTEWASRHSDEPIPATLLADDAVGPPLADAATTLTHTI